MEKDGAFIDPDTRRRIALKFKMTIAIMTLFVILTWCTLI